MPNTVKYCLKADRSRTVDVISPFFTHATIVDAKGVKTEMQRGEFDAIYEPLLARPNVGGVDLTAPSETKAALARLEGKVDRLIVQIGTIFDAVTRFDRERPAPPANEEKPPA